MRKVLSSPPAPFYSRPKRFPDVVVAIGLFQHALRMKLKPHKKISLGIVKTLDKAVLRMGHRLES